jgi:hypothetical protein
MTRRKLSLWGFALANIAADIPVLFVMSEMAKESMGGPQITQTLHDVATHTFIGAMVLGVVLSLFRFKSVEWWMGCVIGSVMLTPTEN